MRGKLLTESQGDAYASAWSVPTLGPTVVRGPAQGPDVFIARMMNFQAHELFKVTEEDRRDVDVKVT